MAEEFVQSIKFKVDDSDLQRSLSVIEKRAGNIQIRFKADSSASRIISNINGSKNPQAAVAPGDLSSFVREQRHAARSTNAFAVALDSARRGLELFSLKLSRANTASAVSSVSGAPAAVATGAGAAALPLGRLGGLAAVTPGLILMAQMVYQPLKAFSQGSIDLFNTQNRAEKMLEFGMRQNGTADRVQELKDYASDIQRRTIYGDEAMLTAAGGWQNKIRGVDNSKRMMELVADYAAKSTGGGAVSADQMRGFSQQLMQALSGRAVTLKAQGFDITAIEQLAELRRKGSKITEDMELAALEKVLAPVKGMAQDLANTDEGKIIQTQNAMGDLREEVGRRLQPVFARVASSIMRNMPTIGRMFESFGNVVERFVQIFADNADTIAALAEQAVGLLEIISEFPASFGSFAVAAKVASAAIGVQGAGGSASGLLGSLGGLGGGLMKLATSSAWGLLVGEIALIGTTLWEAYKEASKAKETRRQIKEDGNVRQGVIGSFRRYRAGEISEESYKEVFDRAKYMGYDMSGSYYDIWKTAERSKSAPGGLDMDKMMSQFKNMKPVTNNIINVNNEIKTDSDMTAKIIKDQLRELTTSRLNFSSRTAVAKAVSL